jgi:antitoxin component YwqK of YwqJK toxin-antitoxin module
MKTYKVEVDDNGNKFWYLNGQLHREDGPAIEWADGTKKWFLNGKLHREDAPAIEWGVGGCKEWYLNGKCHRDDGPAVEYASGTKLWYFHGVKLTETEWRKRVQEVKAPCVGKVVEIDGVKYKLVEA